MAAIAWSRCGARLRAGRADHESAQEPLSPLDSLGRPAALREAPPELIGREGWKQVFEG
ncbi:MAG: hypothetical protein ACRDRK_05055 [Pseudonocardia sp.]